MTDIATVLNITQSKTSRHLKYLREAGLVKPRPDNQAVNYRISVAPDSLEHQQLNLLGKMVADLPAAPARREKLDRLKES